MAVGAPGWPDLGDGNDLPRLAIGPKRRPLDFGLAANHQWVAGAHLGWAGRGAGYDRLVSTLVSRPDFRPETLLVASSAHGEGMFIAEVAAVSPKPQRIVLRASKHVYSSAWAGNNYQLRYAKTEDLATALADIPVHALVIHREAGWPVPPHLEQLERMIAERSGDWRRIYSASQAMPLGREEFDDYRFTGRLRQGCPQFKVDLTDKLNRSLNF